MLKKIPIIVSSVAATFALQAVENRPNVLVILADDLGYGQLNFGQGEFSKDILNSKIISPRYKCDIDKAIDAAQKSMPNLQKLAQNGIRFTNAYVASPVCGPSRAGFITSRYPSRFGIYGNDDCDAGVDLKERFLSVDFQENNYNTAMIGKYHLGKSQSTAIPEAKDKRDYHLRSVQQCVEEYHPLNRGFDYYYGYNATGAAYYNSPNIFRNFKNVKTNGYITDDLTNEAINFIQKSKDEPFFVYLAYGAPHIPLEDKAPEKYQIFNTGNSEVDNYYATVYAMDSGIGRVIEELKSSQKLDNTIIVFFSDNGGVIDSPEPANGNFRGYKGVTNQGGVHVPMIISWPNKLAKDKTFTQNVSSMDILPSCLSAAGISIPKNLDGVNLLPAIQGDSSTPIHKYLFWSGEESEHWSPSNIPFWKSYYTWVSYQDNGPPLSSQKHIWPAWSILYNNWLLHHSKLDNSIGLFDISEDPNEQNNLADKNPELVKKLTQVYENWIKDKTPPKRWQLQKWQTLLKN